MIVLTDWYYEILSRNKFPLDKVRIIKQGLPVESSAPKRGDHAAQKPIKLVFIGRIYPDKGLLILLEALSSFSEKIFALDVYGQVDDRGYEKECRALSSHNKNIRWHGQLFYKEVMDVIGQYDLLVLPSMIAEMAPLVSREAFAAGIPVIGTDVGGIAEEIRNGENGFLFEMGNVDKLRGILKKISEDSSILNRLYKQLPVPRSFEEVAREMEAEYYAVTHNQ